MARQSTNMCVVHHLRKYDYCSTPEVTSDVKHLIKTTNTRMLEYYFIIFLLYEG